MRNILTFAFMMVLNFGVKAQTHQLFLNLVKGKDYFQVIKTQSSMVYVVNGKTMNTHTTMNSRLKTTVTEKSGDNYNMDISYVSFSINEDLPNGHLQFSSEKKDQNSPVSDLISKIINRKFQAKMSKTGRVIEVTNLGTLLSEVLNDSKLSLEEKTSLKYQFSEFFGKQTFKDNMEAFSAIFPDRPVAKETTWTINTTMKSGMFYEVKSVYKLDDVADNWYLISGLAKLTLANKAVGATSKGTAPSHFNLTGNMKSTIKIDKNTGWIIEATVVQDAKGTSTISKMNQSSKAVNIPMTLKTVTTVKGN